MHAHAMTSLPTASSSMKWSYYWRAMDEVNKLVSSEATAQPVDPDVRAQNMGLKLGFDVCYIVCGIAMDGDKVLMIQEAKPSCRGRWYLPAGRMERNETILDAVKREVLEESGLNFEPEALIAVECQHHIRIRFTLTGRITGGSLKTPAQADKESIQAGWFSNDWKRLQMEVNLRAQDVLPLIDLARSWYKERPFTGLPAQVGHVSTSVRIVAVHSDSSTLQILMEKNSSGSTSLPICFFGWEPFPTTIQKVLKAHGYSGEVTLKGVLQMEHLGKHGEYDGMCLSVVVHCSSQQLSQDAKSQWVRVEDEACVQRLGTAVNNKYGCAKLLEL